MEERERGERPKNLFHEGSLFDGPTKKAGEGREGAKSHTWESIHGQTL